MIDPHPPVIVETAEADHPPYYIPDAQRSLGQVLRDVSRFVIEKGGLVRDLENIGTQVLPYRIKAHQQYHEAGRYVCAGARFRR